MIGSSKNNRENYPRKCFWTKEKETPVFEQQGPGVWQMDINFWQPPLSKYNI